MINKVILVGRITKDPEVRTAGGAACVNFTVACGRGYTDAQGNRQEQTDFIPCVVWRKQAENLGRYVRKGSLLGVEGRIQTRTYDSNGETRYVTEVYCDSIQFLEPKGTADSRQNGYERSQNGYDRPQQNGYDRPQQGGYEKPVETKPEQKGYYEDKTSDVSEDDLPF